MAVISAVVDKITSPSILKNYASLMDSIKGCMQTSLSSKDIGDLVQMQLGDMASWEISSISADGTGEYKTTYSNPGFTSYVMIPDQATVDDAKVEIKAVMGK
jgi:anionic cell wall polymer biosynthesis LytR-Cps2A-Psr (LCP) family protein